MSKARTGVRRMSRVETRAKWKALARRVRQLWGRLPADTVPERIERYTSLDNQLDIEAEAVVTELENDYTKVLVKPKQQRNTLEVALEWHRQREAWLREELAEGERKLAMFVARFSHAVEQLVKIRSGRWKSTVAIALALACDFPLTYLALSFVMPDLGTGTGLPGVIAWVLSNAALVAAVSITWGLALVTKSCGREAAWAFCPLVRNPAERGELDSSSDPAELAPMVYSDRTRRSHRIAFAALAATLFALIGGLVLLREPALMLLGSLSGGSDIGGLAGSEASQQTPGGTGLLLGLLAVSSFPLIVAAWVSYLREAPLPNRLAALTDDVATARNALIKVMKTRGATEAELANVGATTNVILAERDTRQVLARLVPHLGHEVMVEALPELFGAASTTPHPMRWPAEKLASRFPAGTEVVSEWFPVKPDPRTVKITTPSTNGSRPAPAGGEAT